MPTDPEIEAAVKNALDVRNEQADPTELGTLICLARGKLRLDAHTPLAAFAQQAVDWFVSGRRNSPPTANRPQLRSLVQMKCHSLGLLGVQAPPAPVIEVLVNFAAGWMNDHSLPTLPGVGHTILVDQTVGLFLAGAAPS